MFETVASALGAFCKILLTNIVFTVPKKIELKREKEKYVNDITGHHIQNHKFK